MEETWMCYKGLFEPARPRDGTVREYLENNSQLRKLQLYLSVRSILLFSFLFATIWFVYSLLFVDDVIIQEEHKWVVDGAIVEVNYCFVLTGICFLWRPNSHGGHVS